MLTSNSTVIYDPSGNAAVGATAAAVPAGAVQMGGSDGTNLVAVRTDSSGRTIAVGPAAAGASPVGNPLYVAGYDGTNLQALRTDTSGRTITVGAAASGTAVTGNPVLVGGQDGANARTFLTDSTGRLRTVAAPAPSGTATLSNVASSATSVVLLASNSSRLGATIVNDGSSKLFVKFGATASSTSYTVMIPAGGYYEVPFYYTGQIDGIWSSANGSARVTEMT